MELRNIVSYLQKSKNLTAKEIYQTASSECMYNNFISGLQSLPWQVVLKYLENLHITVNELLEFSDKPNSELFYYVAMEANLNGDVDQLNQIKKQCQKYQKDYKNDAYSHIVDIINLWTKNDEIDVMKLNLIKYLLGVKQWTVYEFRMLYAIILTLPFELADYLYQRSKNKIYFRKKQYQKRKEAIWLDFYYIVACLQVKKWSLVERTLKQIRKKLVSEYMLTERIILILVEDIYQIVKNPNSVENHSILKQDLKLMKRLDCERLISGTLKLLVKMLEEQQEIGLDLIELFPF